MASYTGMVAGTFIDRPNRFIAHVLIDGTIETCHVKNTGRCRELLLPGAKVWCQTHDSQTRKTKYSLIAVEKGTRLINMDSQIPNQAAFEWIQAGGLGFVPDLIRRESVFLDSRFDFYLEYGERKVYLEVKGVTLEKQGRAMFPDAPTQRGTKHIKGLQQAVSQGYEAYVLFVIQMDQITSMSPNWATDRAFSQQLCQAAQAGVHILAMQCQVTPHTIQITKQVRVELDHPEEAESEGSKSFKSAPC